MLKYMLINQGFFDDNVTLLTTWSLFAATNPLDLEPDLVQFLMVDAADWDWAAQETGDEALREIHVSIEHDYGLEESTH